ncbi:hypothetical protein E5676_scaffold143G00690 [Cucumis melo var. makuwa]|uniref:Uncharacterized protein n=1 Tax=Cucumis melo var. makuwa TaxID=1194695 RepID=A0A5D3C359_CUCMM|nr:hypothetical protein E5676_scaffold143G00690 [Cucumis melo var. makuwa]
MDVTFLEDKSFFPVSSLQRESVSEEGNWPILFIPLAPTKPPETILHDTVLPTNQVLWITN